MKVLILLTIILLSGCAHERHSGDCVISSNYGLYKILEVGKHGGYLVKNQKGETINWHSLMGGFNDTDCFNTFDSELK